MQLVVMSITKHFKNVFNLIRWKNACIYDCQICRNFSSRWPRDLKLHVSAKHKITSNDYQQVPALPYLFVDECAMLMLLRSPLSRLRKLSFDIPGVLGKSYYDQVYL